MDTHSSLSVLAVGISGCVKLYEKLGDSEASRAVDRCLKRIERSVEAAGGRLFQADGEEAITVFEAAETALNTAVEMQQRIADLPPVSGVKMAIRVGISCGAASPPGQPGEELVKEAARLAGVAKSGQILALERIRKALPESMRTLTRDTGVALPGESGRDESVVEVFFEPPAAKAAGCLRLHYGEDIFVLDEHRPAIHLGRDGACEVIVKSLRASRRHATIKQQGNFFVLIDQSTNGTYVTIDGDTEQFVKHGECALHGNGVIAFASPASASDADCARFECP
jgi:hypothetical protein